MSDDFVTIKYLSGGTPVWTNSYNGPGGTSDSPRGLVVDSAGNVIVTGVSPGSGTGIDYATIKYLANGTPAWTNRYSRSSAFDDWVYAIAVDSAGNVIVTGQAYTNALGASTDYATIKYLANGTPAWTNLYNGPGNNVDIAYSVATDSAGNIFVTGGSRSSSSSTSPDYATIKYLADGTPVWTNRYNGPGNAADFALSLTVDRTGNVIVTGNSPGSGTSSDYATIKYLANGTPAWTNRFNGPGTFLDEGRRVAVDGAGSVYITGESSNGTNPDYLTIKYLASGTPVWTNRYNGTGNGSDQAKSLAVDGAGNVFVTGSSYNGTDTDYLTVKYAGNIVTTLADGGSGSLRAAVSNAAPGDTITFDLALSGQTITLTSGEITLDKNLTIDASALAAGIAINGNNASRAFYLASGATNVLNSLTFTNCSNAGGGGAIDGYGDNIDLTLNDCSFINNASPSGAGGAVLLESINGFNRLTVNRCTFSGNTAGTYGGAIASARCDITLNQCTIAGNYGVNVGGVYGFFTSLLVNQSTVTGNTCGGGGIGGVSTYYNASLTLFNSIVAGSGDGGEVTVADTLLGINLTNGTPLLAPLGNYGGKTKTMPPLSGSPALDAGGDSATNSFATDQRGFTRLTGAHVDLGAVEATLVTTLADGGAGSLRQAVSNAVSGDYILFATNLSGGTILLTNGQITLDKHLTLDGAGLAAGIAINGNNASRIFNVPSSRGLTLIGLTLTNANGGGGNNGGAIRNLGTTVLQRCTLTGNSTGNAGGAAHNEGGGSLALTNCTITGNTAPGGGGGLSSWNSSPLVVSHCTITTNSGSYGGGGIYNFMGPLTVANSIIAGNTSSGSPAGADIRNEGNTSATVTRVGANLIQNFNHTATGTDSGPAAINAAPLLAALGSYGGPTKTMPPRAGSPAIDTATNGIATADQRGVARPLDGDGNETATADIGAVEANFSLTLTNLADSGAGSLRQMVADAIPGATITFATNLSGATILLTSGQIVLSKNLTLDASALPAGVAINGNSASRAFAVNTGVTSTLKRLHLTNCVAAGAPDGGYGAAIHNGGTLTLVDCSVSGSSAFAGGAIYNGASGNAILMLNNCTFSGNTASHGGAIQNEANTYATNCTFSGNSGSVRGGAISATFGRPVVLAHCTLSGNSSAQGGGIHIGAGGTTLYNSIVAGNTATTGADIDGTPTLTGNNLTNGNPLLAALGGYGGLTMTMPPLAGSPAIDAATNAIVATDQRGVTRPIGAAADIGAVEANVVTTLSDSGTGSLRAAISNAVGNDYIVFATNLSGGTIVLTSGEIVLTKNLTLDGWTLAGGLTLSGNNASRIFHQTDTNAIFNLTGLSLIAGNSGGVDGGAIRSLGALNLTSCTLSGNYARDGGAIASFGPLTLVQCTLSSNNCSRYGGAIKNSTPMTLKHCTISGNTAFDGGGIRQFTTGFTMNNSIVAGNTLTDLTTTNNINGGFSGSNNITSGNALLAALGSYGGPTKTMPPLFGSPAINAAIGSTLTNDQRGFPRPSGLAADIGAVEATLNVPTDIALSAASVFENHSIGTFVGFFTATDSDVGDTHTFTLVSGAGDTNNASFSIVNGTNLVTAAVFDFELQAGYNIRVRATDSTGNTFEKPLTITVANVNDAPSFTLPAGTPIGGSVVAWGAANSYTTVPGAAQSGVMAVAANYENTVALKTNGSVLVWGGNTYGQTNVPVAAQSGVTAIAAGQYHIVALKTDGSVIAWGRNENGQTNVPVAAQSGVVAISARNSHTMALKNDGSVLMWGTYDQSTVPVAAQSGVTAIAAGGYHFVALKTNGSVLVWGDNLHGQTNVPIAAQSGVTAIAAGDGHIVALKSDGSVLAWGWNGQGQTIVPVAAQSGVVAIAAGFWHTVALKNDGSVIAWGWNDSGQTDVPVAGQSGVTAIAAGWFHTAALAGGGTNPPVVTVAEDSGAQTFSNFATNITAGPADESGQTLNFVIDSNSNPSLFSVTPAVAANGTLTFTTASNATGSASIVLHLHDNGGTANGGVDNSATQTFTITVTPVNDAPDFTKGSNQTVLEDAGAQSVTGWATGISAGPSDESGQTLNFVVDSNSNPGLFSVAPAVAANGTLTFTTASNATGSATIVLHLHDNGGTANGGVDNSATQTFTITMTDVNDAPTLALGDLAGTTWTARESSRQWFGAASSADGTKLVATTFGGQLYTSTNSGATWTARESTRNWWSVASSTDGTKLVATTYGGQLYTSTDSGVTWTARDSSRPWSSVASSADGTKLVAVAGAYSTGQIYTSTDSGTNWTARESSRQWYSVASSADGTKLVAAEAGGPLYTSTDSGVTWTPHASVGSRNWTYVASSSDGTKLVATVGGGQIYTSADSGATWTARDSTRDWYAVASSADGTRLVATDYGFGSGGRIYTSMDSGVTWTQRESARLWKAVASSSDGTKLVAGVEGGQLYTSAANLLPIVYESIGATWTAQTGAGTRQWRCVAGSADGTKLVAGVYNGQLYTSTDSGVTWTARENNRDWYSVASSADGTKLMAVHYGGYIYTSADSGVTWTGRMTDANRGWHSVACSSDGTKLVAAVDGGQIYTSTDSGVTWTARESSRLWYSVASSADGTKLVGVVQGGKIFTSTDSGVTWTARENNRSWFSVASSADGTKLVAVANNGHIYTSTDSGVNWTARLTDSNRNWYSVASSADGTILATGNGMPGKIYVSTDSGATWTARENNRYWNSFAVSADGTKLAAVVLDGSGQIYTSVGNSISSLSINEDAGAQTVNLSGISAGAGESQTLTVTATSSSPGIIPTPSVTYTSANSTGSISFTPATNANGTVTLSVKVQDNGGTANGGVDAVTNTFTVVINPANDAPTNITLSAASIAENQSIGTTVGTLAAIDPDAGDTATFELVLGAGGDDNASFAIVGNALQTAEVFDFETKATYSIRVRATDAGANESFEKQFTITVSNVGESPAIIEEPVSLDLLLGSPASFTVTAAGDAPFAYRWRKDGTNINGATNTSYSLAAIATNQAGNYDVVVTNAYGSVTSAVAALTVLLPPGIAAHPHGQTNYAGASVTFSVTATGTGPLDYQWRKNGVDITNATNSTFNLTGVTFGSGGSYDVVVSSPHGAATSAAAVLLVILSDGTPLWTNRYAGPVTAGADQARAVAVDINGNVIVTGNSDGTGSGQDYLTVKYSGAGTPLWTNRYNGPASTNDAALAVAADVNGTVFVTGGSRGTGTGSNDFATIAYSSAGAPLWTNRYNGPANSNDVAVAIVVDNAGNVLVTGTSQGGGSGNDFATIKYSSTGAALWTTRFNGLANSNDTAAALAVDAARNVYVAGQTIGTGSNDIVTIKYSSAGVPRWTNYYNGPGNSNDVAVALAVDAGGDVFVAGYSRGSGSGNDYVVVKYSNAGDPIWTNRYNGPANGADQAAALATDAAGGVFVTGVSAGSGSGNDFATVKYSSAGVPLWTNRYNGPANGADTAQALAVDGSGNVLAAGVSAGVGSGNDYAVVKYSNAGAQIWVNRYNGPGNGADSAFCLGVDSGGYVIAAGGSGGSGTGDDYATIKYQGALQPFITAQPQSQVLYPGTNATFRVTAAGLAPLSYQWRKNGLAIPNATNASHAISGLTTNDNGSFDVVLTNYHGSVTSAVATLNVTLAPFITVQAPGQVVFPGASVTFTMAAVGELPLAYQWRKNGTNLAGANSASHSLTGVTIADNGGYTLVVTNVHGAVTSAVAALTVVVVPSIAVQPASQMVVEGANVSFTVVAAGGALAYQWRRDGFILVDSGNIVGANSATLTLTDVAESDAGSYSVFVSNPAGSVTSSNATLNLVVPPEITIPPASQNVAAGRNVTFTVAAFGTAPLAYQWRQNSTNLAGATNAALTLNNVGASNAGSYTVVVTNLGGSATSAAATLTVRVPPTITLQPQSQFVGIGANVTFTVAATGTPPLTYQWQNNGVKIQNATNTSLLLSEVQGTNAGGYNVIVSGPDAAVASATATLVVDLPALPFADHFTNRVTTNSYSGAGSGGNTNASRETGEPRHANKTGGKSVWLNWQAPTNGAATFSTRGTGFDTMLAVYAGTNLATLTEVASDDDSGGLYTSQVSFNAVAGTNYAIAVDGLANAAGRIVLNWSLDDTVADVPRFLVHPVNQTVAVGATVTFTTSATGTAPLSYQWYFRGAVITDATNDSLTIANVQRPDVGAYLCRVNNGFGQTAQSLPAILEIGGNAAAQSKDKFEDLFEIVGVGSGSSFKTIRRRLASYPSVSAGAIGTQIFNNLDSADQLNQPISGAISGGSTRWFIVQAAASGIMVIDTIGSDINTVMAVYTGTNLLELARIAEDDNGAPDGIRSRVSFTAAAGTDYVIAVDGVGGAQGNIALNWALGTVPTLALQPADRKATVSETVVFSAQAAGIPAPTYQWRKNGVVLPGQTAATLVLNHVLTEDAGWYDVVVSNFAGLAVSEPASLTVGTAARLVNHTRAAGSFSMTIQTEVGKTYELQSTDSLESGNWNTISSIPGTGAFQVFADTQAASSRRFYRLVIY